MLIDMHVHTSRYSACGRSSPEEMVAQAIAVGLDALAFTEHNILWPEDEVTELQAQFPQIKLLRGVELTSAEGEDYLVHGVLDGGLFAAGIPSRQIIDMVRERNGAIVLAHPYRFHPEVPDVIKEKPLDAIETRSINIFNYAHRPGEQLAQRLGLPVVATSDGHHVDELGFYATHFETQIHSEHDLARVLRQHRFEVWCDSERIAERNVNLQAKFGPIRELFAQGYDDSAVRTALPEFVTHTFVHNLRQGRDVLMPTRQDGRC